MKFSKIFLFTGLLVMLYAPVAINGSLFKRPHGDHAWAQCDRASIALNYFQFNYPFLEPRTNNLAFNPSGIATGEFPLLPYIVSKCYSVFGFHELAFRTITLLFSLLGFYIAFLVAGKFLKNPTHHLLASVMWLISPNIIFYSTGFLPDNVALTFFIAGFYLICESGYKSFKRLMLFAVFSSVAVLLKSSAIFLVGAVYVSLLITSIPSKIFRRTFYRTVVIFVPIAVSCTWILYGSMSQQIHHSSVFKLGVMLPRSMDDIIFSFRNLAHLIPSIYPLSIFLAVLFLLVYSFKRVRVSDFMSVFTLVGLSTWLFFFFLMMRNAGHHGYYHVPFQFLVFSLTILVFKWLEESDYHLFKTGLILKMLFILVSYGLYANTLSKISTHYELINKDWLNLEPALRKAGIKPYDKIASADDRSYNISLYLMNQRGWTFMSDDRDSYKWEALSNCDYAVLSDISLIHNKKLESLFGEEMAVHGSLHIYRLRH